MNSNTKKILTWVGLGCSALGCLLSVIFSIVTCAKGKWTINFSAKNMSDGLKVKMSLAFIGTIIGIVIAIAGIVLTIIGLEREGMMFKVAIISLVVSAFAVLYGTISTVTVCSYGCTINKGIKKAVEKESKKSSSSYDYDYDYDYDFDY